MSIGPLEVSLIAGVALFMGVNAGVIFERFKWNKALKERKIIKLAGFDG